MRPLEGINDLGDLSPLFCYLKNAMLNRETFESIVRQRLEETDIFLVEVQFKPGNKVQVYIDKPDGITIDECVSLSRHVTSVLDKDAEDYDLEVSSPGLDMGFRVEEQYTKYLGKEVKVVMLDGSEYKGILKDYDAGGIDLEYEKTVKEEGKKKKRVIKDTIHLDFEQIKTTKAVVSFK